MDQNTENPNADSGPLFEEPPVTQSTSAPVETTESVLSAADEVIDVPAEPASPPTYTNEPPLQPEIVSGSTQAPPQKSNNGWVIALVVLLVLCCCCLLFFVPALLVGKALLVGIYSTIINVLNSIFGGAVRFY